MSEQKWRLVPVDERGRVKVRVFPDTPAVSAPLAAAPPLPRAVFDEMVERVARAMQPDLWKFYHGELFEPKLRASLARADVVLRAALPGLRVEGDQEDGHG